VSNKVVSNKVVSNKVVSYKVVVPKRFVRYAASEPVQRSLATLYASVTNAIDADETGRWPI
jgi:hypothetical protein